MPKASYKSKGGDKDSAVKNTFNPPGPAGQHGDQQRNPEQQEPGRPIGQFGGAGEPPLMKK